MHRKTKQKYVLLVLVLIFLLTGCAAEKGGEDIYEFPVLTGEYLGQVPPGDEPELFAPGIITTGMNVRDIALTPDGKEIYFGMQIGGYKYTKILVTKLENGKWTEPEVASFCGGPEYMDLEPFIAPDGKKLYFLSNRPEKGKTEGGTEDIWVADRNAAGWGEPYNLGAPVNTENREFFPSLTKDGTIYFTRAGNNTRTNEIFRSKLVDGKYTEPEKLGKEINSGANRYNAFIAPDESYIIVPVAGGKGSLGGTDYYICFHGSDDKWSEPVNLGEKINSAVGQEWSPYVTPDGKYFFFMASRLKENTGPFTLSNLKKMYNEPQHGNSDIYWVSASFINKLRPEGF